MKTEKIRTFNRFYAGVLGVYDQKYLGSDYSVTQVRILRELLDEGGLTAGHLTELLRVDKGYLSRILKGLEQAGLVERRTAKEDHRKKLLFLTTAGKAVGKELNRRADKQVREQMKSLSDAEIRTVEKAMETIITIMRHTNEKA